MSNVDIDQLASEYASKSPQQILELAISQFDNLWLSFSGADDIVALDMAWKINPEIKVFTLDTGRLHAETYRFLEQVRKHYGIQLEVLSPDHQQLEAYVRENGLFDFYENGHGGCCGVRKIAPLRRKLGTVDAWITGRKRFQNSLRAELEEIEQDDDGKMKVNPLARWTATDIAAYLDRHALPRHPLVAQGYPSIGCEPCTSRVADGEDPRAGRWRGSDKTECGIHYVEGQFIGGGGI